jgi:hypothetical protein
VSAEVGPKLYESGYKNVTCVDISPVVISWMRARYSAYSELEFAVMDVCATASGDLEADMFDLIVDKALTDALSCGDEPARLRSALSNLFTALRAGGKYVVVSHAPPSRRLELLGCTRSTPGYDAVSALEPAGSVPASSGAALGWSAVEAKRLAKLPLASAAGGATGPACHWIYILTK